MGYFILPSFRMLSQKHNHIAAYCAYLNTWQASFIYWYASGSAVKGLIHRFWDGIGKISPDRLVPILDVFCDRRLYELKTLIEIKVIDQLFFVTYRIDGSLSAKGHQVCATKTFGSGGNSG